MTSIGAAPAGAVTVNATVASSPAFASLTGCAAGSAFQPAGSGSATSASSASRPARTRTATAAGRPLTSIVASRVGVTVAGGTITNGRRRSPSTGSAAACSTGTAIASSRSPKRKRVVTASGGGPSGSPASRGSVTACRPRVPGAASQYGTETGASAGSRIACGKVRLLAGGERGARLERRHPGKLDPLQHDRRGPAQRDLQRRA